MLCNFVLRHTLFCLLFGLFSKDAHPVIICEGRH